MNAIVWPWMAEIALISWRSMEGVHLAVSGSALNSNLNPSNKNKVTATLAINDGVKRPPLPSELLASFVAFGLFAAIADKNATVGNLLGWGIVLATFMAMAGSPPTANITNPTLPGASPAAPGVQLD